MVGLQRPQGEPGLKPEDLEEDNKMICLSNQDEFVLSQVGTFTKVNLKDVECFSQFLNLKSNYIGL